MQSPLRTRHQPRTHHAAFPTSIYILKDAAPAAHAPRRIAGIHLHPLRTRHQPRTHHTALPVSIYILEAAAPAAHALRRITSIRLCCTTLRRSRPVVGEQYNIKTAWDGGTARQFRTYPVQLCWPTGVCLKTSYSQQFFAAAGLLPATDYLPVRFLFRNSTTPV